MTQATEANYRRLHELKNWAGNYNEGDVGAITVAIRRYGYNRTISVWHDGVVMAGNHTLLALRALYAEGWEPAGNIYRLDDGEWAILTSSCSHLSEREAREYAIADNRLAERATTNDRLLLDYLREAYAHDQETGDNSVEVMGYDDEAIRRIMRQSGRVDEDSSSKTRTLDEEGDTSSDGSSSSSSDSDDPDAGDRYQAPADEPLGELWTVHPGDLFEVQGDGPIHRVMCGDPVTPSDRIELIGSRRKVGVVHTFPRFAGAFDPQPILSMGKVVIFWGAERFTKRLFNSTCWYIWDRGLDDNYDDPTRSRSDALLAWSNATGQPLLMAYQDTSGENVPQSLPVQVAKWAIDEHQGKDLEEVFDPYCRDGSTLLAADELMRPSYSMDPLPIAIAATLKRLEEAGLKVRRLNGVNS